MKPGLSSSVALAGLLGVLAFSQSASASILISNQENTIYPGAASNPTPFSSTNWMTTQGSIPNSQLSPWTGDPTPPTGSVATAPYSCVSCGTGGAAGDAIYQIPVGDTQFSLFWGSPDTYNIVEFFASNNGTGSPLASFNGASLTPPAPGNGFDVVTWSFNGTSVGSVELIDTGTAAFEYANPLASTTPLPATLPLFAGGLGLVGLLSRKKRKAAALAAA